MLDPSLLELIERWPLLPAFAKQAILTLAYSIFLMDYANCRRVKLWGIAKVIESDPELLETLRDPNYPGKVERAILFTIEAWDVNCPQHIHRRFSDRQIAPVLEKLQQRVSELEGELAKLRDGARQNAPQH